MKRIIGVLFLLLFVIPACLAQEKSDYRVRYMKEHLLYANGEEVSVIDVDLEWPEDIDGADLRPLHAYLFKTLMGGVQGNDFGQAYEQFKAMYGQPVTKQFASTPDDGKMCYVSISLRLLAHEAGRYVSFDMKRSCSPGSDATKKKEELSELLTYDLVGLEILRRDDVLLRKRMENRYIDFRLLMPPHAEYLLMSTLSINDACLARDKVLLYNSVLDDYGQPFSYQLMLSPQSISSFLSKKAKELLKKRKGKPAVSVASKRGEPETFVGQDGTLQTVCAKPDVMPEFQIPGRKLSEYMSENIRAVDKAIDGVCSGQTFVKLTIDKEGNTCGVRIVNPLAPAYDREAARVAWALPRWKPAVKDGVAVAAQVLVGIGFNM